MIKLTFDHLSTYEHTFFDKDQLDKFYDSRICHGDGYYIFFTDPLRAFLFSIYFNSNIRHYNSNTSKTGTELQHLYNVIGELIIRNVITYDETYIYNSKYWGSSVIHNSRILSLDKLNRFLIDNNTFLWFINHTNGIETLACLTAKNLFENKELNLIDDYTSLIFLPFSNNTHRIKNLIVQKIGNIEIKDKGFDVYNIFIQVFSFIKKTPTSEQIKYISSIGNLNTENLK